MGTADRAVAEWRVDGVSVRRTRRRERGYSGVLEGASRALKRGGVDEPRRNGTGRSSERVTFVELASPPASVSPAEGRAQPFEVLLPVGYRVRVAGGFERGTLVKLLDVLEAR